MVDRATDDLQGQRRSGPRSQRYLQPWVRRKHRRRRASIVLRISILPTILQQLLRLGHIEPFMSGIRAGIHVACQRRSVAIRLYVRTEVFSQSAWLLLHRFSRLTSTIRGAANRTQGVEQPLVAAGQPSHSMEYLLAGVDVGSRDR